MHGPECSTRKSYLMASVAAVGALATTAIVTLPANDAEAWQSPTKHRYLTAPLQLCDRGTFYVGGAPKLTRYGGGPQAGQAVVQKIIGDMYVQFATPMVAKSWPLIMVHGSGYTGSCVEGTAGGSEGWADYTVRNGVPTYVVDQAGRGRSGFDQTVIHEGEALIDTDTTAAKNLIPTLGGSTSTAWTSWFGHIVPEGATPPRARSAKPQLTPSKRLVVRPIIFSWTRQVGGRVAMLVRSGMITLAPSPVSLTCT
jgi:hypothetical protein